jgi:molecular chaperone GrpE
MEYFKNINKKSNNGSYSPLNDVNLTHKFGRHRFYPDMSDEAVRQLEEEKRKLMEELLYTRAELANLRRVMEQEVRRAESAATAGIAAKLITLYEDFERVVNGLGAGDVPAAAAEAVQMLFRELGALLQQMGVERMDVKGKEFNPFDHEAVEFFESDDVETDTVAEVITPGYRLGDRILRPPRVRVARPRKHQESSQPSS